MVFANAGLNSWKELTYENLWNLSYQVLLSLCKLGANFKSWRRLLAGLSHKLSCRWVDHFTTSRQYLHYLCPTLSTFCKPPGIQGPSLKIEFHLLRLNFHQGLIHGARFKTFSCTEGSRRIQIFHGPQCAANPRVGLVLICLHTLHVWSCLHVLSRSADMQTSTVGYHPKMSCLQMVSSAGKGFWLTGSPLSPLILWEKVETLPCELWHEAITLAQTAPEACACGQVESCTP